MKLFIFGAGFTGKAAGRAFVDSSHSVSGTTRDAEKAALLAEEGIHPVVFDAEKTDPALLPLGDVTHLLISVAPDENGDPVLASAGDAIVAMPKLQWIGYLSTVGVYGDYDGAWVDEESECAPVSKRSQMRLEAEDAWRVFAAARSVPLAVMRLSGIYGPGRNTLVNLAEGKARRMIKPGQVFNRVHVADVAGACRFLAEGNLGGTFNVTDDEPAPPQDVVTFAAGLMGVEPPPEQPFVAKDLSPMARSFYGENKRVSNAKLRAAGYVLKHPEYRGSLTSMWQDGNWRG